MDRNKIFQMSDGGTIVDNRRYHLQLKEANYVHLMKVLNSNHRAFQSVKVMVKLQALVYDIRPSTTAVFSYAIGSRKLSASEQFFLGAQTVVSLLQTTQIISDVCFITDHVAYASSNKTKIVGIETELFFSSFLPGIDAPHVYVRAWVLGCFYSTRTFRRALTASVDRCAEIELVPLQWGNQIWQSVEEGAGKRCSGRE